MSNIIIQQPHPLRRSGTKRIHRLLEALSPDHFQLDDRSVQDLLVTAHRYAELLAWYDLTDRPDGDWTCFWETESLTYLAVLANTDLNQLRKEYDDADRALGLLLESTGEGEVEREQAIYRQLCEIILKMASGLQQRYRKLQQIDHPLQHLIAKMIKKDNVRDQEELEYPLRRLIAIHKGKDDDVDIEQYRSFIYKGSPWGLEQDLDYGRIMALGPIDTPREQLRAIYLHFYQTYVLLQARAQRAFDKELARMERPETEEYRIVQPHISLFLTFLRLFRHAQDSLNGLVERHLDFYYEQVLALQPAPAQPDSVHLIFELAKNFDAELVAKGTRLVGGKDKNGRPLFYETVRDWVVTSAKLESIKSFYLPQNAYAFNYATSAGLTVSPKTVVGTSPELPLPNEGVRIFGDTADAVEQEVGFVIASPQLLLQEGRRLVQIEMEVPDNSEVTNIANNLIELHLSTEEGWTAVTEVRTELDTQSLSDALNGLPVSESCFSVQYQEDTDIDTITIYVRIHLAKDFPPVIASPAIAMSQRPAVKISLKPNMLIYMGKDYGSLIAQPSSIKISVRAEDISKHLILQTDQGVFNGTQEIMPFGPTAPKGARFYVGFAEAFLKKLTLLQLKPNWINPFGSCGEFSTYYTGYTPLPSSDIEIAFLKNNVFTPITFSEGLCFVNEGNDRDSEKLLFDNNALSTVLSNRSDEPKNAFTEYDPTVKRGFVRITFQGELYHGEYAEKLANAIIVANGTATDLPNPPYTPNFNALELTYVSEGQIMEDNLDEFYYLHPFDGYERAVSFEGVTLFKDWLTETNRRGTLYLGFNQLRAGTGLSLLVQTVEGSEKKPNVLPPRLSWYYLTANNNWRPIPVDKILLDSTRSFTKSGIIQLAIPDDLSSEGNTILDPVLHWLKVCAADSDENPKRLTAALPDLAYIRAQVIEARLATEVEYQYEHLIDGQPSSTISKLALSRSAIKKIDQPFSTFGGRVAEAEGMDFYLRISERLRHRNRAVTVWDYERLLLEAFPDIATAKCTPHTQYELLPQSELAPGQVVIAVVPSLAGRSGYARLQPRFPKGVLDDMQDFLTERTSFFLNVPNEPQRLFVVNGQYERIKLDFKVVFNDDVADEDFYLKRLNEELFNYLSPWVEGESEPCFEQAIRRSQLIAFVEQRPYVQYVDVDVATNTAADVAVDTDRFIISKDDLRQYDPLIMPGAAHGILCSAPQHNISIYQP